MTAEANMNRKALVSSTQERNLVWPMLAYAALAGLAFLTLVPIVWMVLTSFKSEPELAANPPTLWPRE
jgi:ABC-type glycerol-3-phosphate transport system permease component